MLRSEPPRSGGDGTAPDVNPVELPPFLRTVAAELDDDRTVPELGLGDAEATESLLLAIRVMLTAGSVEEVSAAMARFVLALGGRLVPAARDDGTALPLDITFGASAPLLPWAEPYSVVRMRLEQLLPRLMEDARAAASRLRHLHDMEAAARTDPLTGLLSRRQLMRVLGTARPGDVVVVVDLDDFKTLNDDQGHAVGDAVLASVGGLLAGGVRSVDRAGRYGGDEFVLLLRDVSEDVARVRLEDLQRIWLDVRPADITFSAGMASVDAGGWCTALPRADAALYRAKRAGRGRTATTVGET